MEAIHFEKLWQLLNPQGEYCRRRKACERLWTSFLPAKQQAIYQTLVAKKANGDYVSPNPYFAIDDNDQPQFLSGVEQDKAHAAGIPIVLVAYQDRFLVCSRETMEIYGLQYVRDA